MKKSVQIAKEWPLNLKDANSNPIQINAIVDLYFKDLMEDVLKLDKFAVTLSEKDIPDKWHFEDNALWFDKTRLYIPESLRIRAKELSHDSPLAGQWGIARTTDLTQRNYYWPNMTRDIKEYVTGCQFCNRNKTKTHKL